MQQPLPFTVCAEGCETAEEQSDDEVRTSQVPERREGKTKVIRQQHLPFTVCAEGCETAEEQSDDEVRTSQVPERSEGKTKVIRQQYLLFTVLKLDSDITKFVDIYTLQQHLPLTVLKPDWIKCCARTSFRVATTPIVYGMRRRGRGSRGARRR